MTAIDERALAAAFDILWPAQEWNGEERVCRAATRATITAYLQALRPGSTGETEGWLVTNRATGHKSLELKPLADLPFNHERFTWEPLYRAADVLWQDITNAPKDGSQFLAFARSELGQEFMAVAQWAEPDGMGSVAGWFWTYAIRPTAWRPLPSPPSAMLAAAGGREG